MSLMQYWMVVLKLENPFWETINQSMTVIWRKVFSSSIFRKWCHSLGCWDSSRALPSWNYLNSGQNLRWGVTFVSFSSLVWSVCDDDGIVRLNYSFRWSWKIGFIYFVTYLTISDMLFLLCALCFDKVLALFQWKLQVVFRTGIRSKCLVFV